MDNFVDLQDNFAMIVKPFAFYSRKSHAEFRNFMRVRTISIPVFFTIISSGVGAGLVGTAMARQKFFRLQMTPSIVLRTMKPIV